MGGAGSRKIMCSHPALPDARRPREGPHRHAAARWDGGAGVRWMLYGKGQAVAAIGGGLSTTPFASLGRLVPLKPSFDLAST